MTLTNQQKGYAAIVIFVAYAVYMAFNADSLAVTMSTAPIHIALFWYVLGSPQYLLLIYLIVSKADGDILRRAKAFIASLLIVFALDIVGFVRISRASGVLNDVAAEMNSDTHIVSWLMTKTGFGFDVVYWIYYLVIPFILIVGAFWLLGAVEFHKQVTRS